MQDISSCKKTVMYASLRKLLLSFVVLVLMFNGNNYGQGIYTGLKAGINFSDPRGDYLSGKWKFKTGTDLGLIVGYHVSNHFSFQSGFDYTTLHYELAEYYTNYYGSAQYNYVYYPEISRKWDLKYFRLPVLARYSFGNRFKWVFEAGFYWGFLNKAAGEYYPVIYYEPLVSLDYYQSPLKVSGRSTDRGFLFGVGTQYRVTASISVFCNANWATGSNEIWKEDGNDYK